jgi:OmcA/MtrC family decaheme c-type cytochrome
MFLLVALSLIMPLLFLGCSGSDGAQGTAGRDGVDGTNGQDLTAAPNPESCVVCHGDAGLDHQAVYDAYADASTFAVTIDNVVATDNGSGGYNVTMLFTLTQNGLPYIDTAKSSNGNGFPTIEQKTFYMVAYDNATRRFIDSKSFDAKTITLVNASTGQYSVTAANTTYAPELSNAQVYLYVAKGKLAGVGSSYELYNDVFNVGKEFGNVDTYASAANVAGCEKCHGAPYMKHGYRMAKVSGLPDFAACKVCHYDTRSGGHQSWQLLADNPARYAELHELAKIATEAGDTAHNSVEKNMTADEKTKYAYTANVMNDVHMSHAMEFPYPQSMANCATCHDGKLGTILTDAFFVATTCKSCHPETGGKDATALDSQGRPVNKVDTTTFAMKEIWKRKGVDSFHNLSQTCNTAGCHATGGNGKTFEQIHTGYNKEIYVKTGATEYKKYSEVFTVSIDNASLTGNTLTVQFKATESPDVSGLAVTDISPSVNVGLYGYDTKDFVARIAATKVSGANGNWEYTADLSAWAGKIADGSGRRVEIAVLPSLKDADNVVVALNAPSKTFDLGTKALVDFYSPIVKVADGCNNCHDALGTTFHSGNRGGNITVCRMCHVPTTGGSHLEMQSRSIDSYVHAIHSFQAFDIGDVDFTDPVETAMYDLHIEHTYPNFTIKNCKSCHTAGKFNVPDQAKSLPGVLSASDNTSANDWNRNIGAIDSYVVGPASRACGSCHRAKAINEDDAGKLESFNSHTRTMGYLIDYTDPSIFDTVTNAIMANFYDGIVLSTP